MKRKKEKVTFFERTEIEDVNFAKNLLEKEEKKFRIKLIVTAISLVASIIMLLGQSSLSFIFDISPIKEISFITYASGILGVLLTDPKSVIKMIWKTATFCYWIVPFVFFDILAFVLGFCFAIMGLAFLPVIFAAYSLYLTYLNKKDAEAFIAINNAASGYYKAEI